MLKGLWGIGRLAKRGSGVARQDRRSPRKTHDRD